MAKTSNLCLSDRNMGIKVHESYIVEQCKTVLQNAPLWQENYILFGAETMLHPALGIVYLVASLHPTLFYLVLKPLYMDAIKMLFFFIYFY